MSEKKPDRKKLSRRDLFRVTGAAGAGLALGASGQAALGAAAGARDGADTAAGPDSPTVAFHDTHQAGIATAQQEHLHFAALDLVAEEASEVCNLPRAWTEAAARMTQGKTAGDENYSPFLPPDDTGEAFDLSPARLTLTFGFGPSFFEKDGQDRFGLADRRPDALAPLPPLTGDVLDEGRSDGDLCIQLARTTRRWPSMLCGTSSGSRAGSRSCAGVSSASGGRRVPARRRRCRGTSWK